MGDCVWVPVLSVRYRSCGVLFGRRLKWCWGFLQGLRVYRSLLRVSSLSLTKGPCSLFVDLPAKSPFQSVRSGAIVGVVFSVSLSRLSFRSPNALFYFEVWGGGGGGEV